MTTNKIGNYPIDHPLAIYRCKQIADNVKFISEYESANAIRLDRERGDLKHFFWAFTCDSPELPGYDAVKYCERHHHHTQQARQIIIGSGSRSRRKIKGLRHEHVVPLKLIRDMLFNNTEVCAGNFRAVANILKENLCSAVVTREEALHIDRTYRTTMPENWSPGLDPFIRYELTGVSLLKPIHDCE